MTDWVLLVRIIAIILVLIIIIIAFLVAARVVKQHQEEILALQAQNPEDKPVKHKTGKLNPGFLGKKNIRQPQSSQQMPEHIMAVTLMPHYNHRFSGAELAKLVSTFGLQYSPNQVYELIGEGGRDILCTMLNIRAPGILPAPKDLPGDTTQYDGLILILQLPVGNKPLKDWETFLALINEMKEVSHARICDHNRRTVSENDFRRYREEVAEFEKQYYQWLQNQE